MTQFVSVKFNPEQTRTYTYRNDLAPVAVDDRVQVEVHGKPKTVTVVEVSNEDPGYPCKPILGLAPETDDEPVI
ncbi:MAG: hypothetical protein AAF479_10615 [Pseudomonadota bacterium]